MANADRIIELLHEAKGRPAGAEREQFLAAACQDDTALKEQIISLLEADADDNGSFLKINKILHPTVPPSEKPGDRIGRYKLLEQIGEGGCGVVYMAEQLEPVRRRVALKVIKLGMDTKQVIARFEAERQALAMMDHPNIAKVLEAGATDTGRPFFVMELVRGIKITDYCDQNNLATNERLKLFIQVCQAIQHAHQKGIIHRDIKPSNILVTLHDDVAVPKVIDFGIAKATVGQLTDKTVFTAFAQFVGTPAYMSPEQAQMSGLDVDTRADIYSLGVLLYELLTGNTPFDAKELLAAGMDEMRRKIREDEPAKPSTCLSTMQAMDLTTVAKRRHVEPPKLIHLIRGDLDWLVMKCLEKDRTRRYETANGLAMDIQRHLDDEPVIARPPSAAYRFQKLVRRNKLAFAAASAVVAALVLGLGISTWMFFKEKQARERAVAAEQDQARLRREAEAEAAESRQLQRFLSSLGQRLRQERNLTNAEAVLRQELVMEKKLSGDEHPFVANSLHALAHLLSDSGKSNEAEVLLREALAMQRRLLGNEHPDVAKSLHELAHVLRDSGQSNEAEVVFREELAMQRRLSGNEHPDLAKSLFCLGTSLSRPGRHAEAEALIREVLLMQRKLLGKEHADVAKSLFWLGMSLSGQGKHAEAEETFRETLAMYRRLLGNEHREVATSLSWLGKILSDQSKHAEAEATLREALAMYRKLLGNEHRDVAKLLPSLGRTLSRQGKHAEAEEMFREALPMQRRLLGNEHRDTGISLLWLGATLSDQGKHAEAEEVLREALALRRKLAADDLQLGDALAGLASTLLAAQKFTEAEPLAHECLTIREKKIPDDWLTFNARSLLGGSLLGQKRYAEAEPLLLSAYEGMKQREDKIPAASKRHLKETLERLVQLYEATDQSEKAAEWSERLTEFNKAEADKQTAVPKP